jgi:TetR/AcrR family transcriptional repressor of mexJK operon
MNEIAQTARIGRPKDSAKREDIVVAATRLFMQNGYELTSMEAVAREAGVSKLTIYSHFADKNQLFRAIVQYRCDKVGMPSAFLDEASLPAKEAFVKIARHALSIMYRADSLRLMRVIQAEVLHHPEIVQTYYEIGPRRVKAAFTGLLEEFNRQGKLAIPDPTRASEQFFSLLKGEPLQRVLLKIAPAPDAAQIEAHIQTTVEFFLAAYRPSTPTPEAP